MPAVCAYKDVLVLVKERQRALKLRLGSEHESTNDGMDIEPRLAGASSSTNDTDTVRSLADLPPDCLAEVAAATSSLSCLVSLLSTCRVLSSLSSPQLLASWLLHPVRQACNPQHQAVATLTETAPRSHVKQAFELCRAPSGGVISFGGFGSLAACLQRALGRGSMLWHKPAHQGLAIFLVEWGAKSDDSHTGKELLRWAFCVSEQGMVHGPCPRCCKKDPSGPCCLFALRKAPNYQEALGTALLAATSAGRTDRICLLLKEAHADVHAGHDRALRWASIIGNAEVVAVLLEAGADPNAMNGISLRSAMVHNHHRVLELLKVHMGGF